MQASLIFNLVGLPNLRGFLTRGKSLDQHSLDDILIVPVLFLLDQKRTKKVKTPRYPPTKPTRPSKGRHTQRFPIFYENLILPTLLTLLARVFSDLSRSKARAGVSDSAPVCTKYGGL